jgi:hypothetical protein
LNGLELIGVMATFFLTDIPRIRAKFFGRAREDVRARLDRPAILHRPQAGATGAARVVTTNRSTRFDVARIDK